MNVFIAHIGDPGNQDLDRTVNRRRHVSDILNALGPDSPDRTVFLSDAFARAFPDGTFNCWGVPAPARSMFDQLAPGDMVVLVHSEGGSGRGAEAIGRVKIVVPRRMDDAARILWDAMPNKSFPLVFFFDTQHGHIAPDELLREIGWKENYRLRGRFVRAKALGDRTSSFVAKLETTYGFRPTS